MNTNEIKEVINTLNSDDLYDLLNYIEGLPTELKGYIKLHINEFDQKIKSKNTSDRYTYQRFIHEFSTIYKYIQYKNEFKITTNPMLSFYQKEYCSCCSDIATLLPKELGNYLYNILNKECYTIDHLVEIENAVANLFNEYKNITNDFLSIISIKILPYKYYQYDLYNWLLVKDELGMDKSSCLHFTNLYKMIIRTCENKYINIYDFAVLVYYYFKEINSINNIDKLNLLNRFISLLKSKEVDDDSIDEFILYLNGFINRNSSVDYLLGTILSNNLERMITSPDTKLTIYDLDINGKDTKLKDEYIFIFKNIDLIDDSDKDAIVDNLKILSTDEILKYFDMDKNNITFVLNDNDIGHLRNLNNTNVGLCLNNFTKDLKYILKYDNELYLVFKDFLKTKTIYGISLFNEIIGNNYNRKIIEIIESEHVYYKYLL